MHPVADIQCRRAATRHRAQQFEEPDRLAAWQRSCRFVQDDHVPVTAVAELPECPEDSDDGSLGWGELADQPRRIQKEPELVCESPHDLVLAAAADRSR